MKNIFLLCSFILLLSGCFDTNSKDDIKIGMVVGLTGKYANLGNEIKNGALLAFHDIDYKINNKTIKLIIKDDKQDKTTDTKAINELVNGDVKIIIANGTSSMTRVSLDITSKQKDIFQISPTASSSQFSNKDDNFFRVQVANNKSQFKNLIELIKEKNAKHIYFVGDSNNKAYISDYLHLLDDQKNFKYEKVLDSNQPLEKLYQELKNSDFIVIIANTIDTSSLVQYLRIHNNNSTIISSGWAKDKQFIENSGKYANGIYFMSSDYINRDNKQFKAFAKVFKKTYSYEPNRFNMQGYEAAKIIIEALKNGYSGLGIKDYILKTKIFHFLGDKLVFNQYGDVEAPYYIFQIKNNKFIKIK